MSSSARKKEKHRLKRKEKKHQMQRINSRTALQRLAAEGGELECWITPDWKERGMASIQVLGRAPGGHGAFAAFLVDLWAVGLKDAFGRSDVPWLDFCEGNMEPWVERTSAVKLEPQVARRLVAGAVRFGRQNSFRMPPQWEKFVVIFGRSILNEIPTADLSDFGADGGVRYVGTEEFLRSRLTVPVQEFASRPNTHLVIGGDPRLATVEDAEADEEDETDESDPDADDKAEAIDELYSFTQAGAARLAERARQWIAENHAEEIARLDEAAKLVMFSIVPAMDSLQAGKDPTDEEMKDSEWLVEMMLATHDPQEHAALAASVEKLREVMLRFDAEEQQARGLRENGDLGQAEAPAPNAITAPT